MKRFFIDVLKKSQNIINADVTFFLYVSTIFNHFYYGNNHPISEIFSVDPLVIKTVILYGIIIGLINVIKTKQKWQPLFSLLTFVGNVFISILLLSVFFNSTATPSVLQIVINLVYLTNALLAFALLLTILFGKPSERITKIEPMKIHLHPSVIKTLTIIFFIVVANIASSSFTEKNPEDITNIINLLGFCILGVINKQTIKTPLL